MKPEGTFFRFALLLLCVCFVFPSSFYKSISPMLQQGNNPGVSGSSRTRRSVGIQENETTPAKMKRLNLPCVKPVIDDFPADFMTQSQRSQGGAIIHFAVTMYMFAGLAMICDDYFVPSLEKIAEKFHMRPDVAGATLMAAGTSGTELFTAVIGVFITKTDVGLAAIAGSGAFNVFFIVAICGLFASSTFRLSRWPLCRDLLCYLISIVALISTTYDKKVYWYEALVMIVLYLFYVIVMRYNKKLEGFFQGLASAREDIETNLTESEKNKLLPKQTIPDEEDENLFSNSGVQQIHVIQRNNDSPFSFPQKVFSRTLWIIALPLTFLFYITIPDCRRERWAKWYFVSFVLSLVWMALLTYVLTWMVAILGFTLHIPDEVMALTFLAAGSSVPDALSSLIVARQGNADMAVSHAIGSNVFNILFCLGLPWLLQTTVVDFGGHINVMSNSMTYTTLALFTTAVIPIPVIMLNKWYLSKCLGIIFVVLYLLFAMFTILFAINVFGQFDLQMCLS